MNRPIVLALVLFLATAAFAADMPVNADKASLVAQLQRTEGRFLKAIEGLSEAQWSYKPSPERWSIAECAEHITASEPFIRGYATEAMKKDLTAEMLPAAKQDEKILTALVDRSTKFKAPEPLIPTNRFGSPQAAIDAFKKERAETIRAAAGEVDLRTHGAPHPFLGPLDAHGYFLFLSAHSERHTLQIEEVKADPNFPKQ
jgi:DinB superfamily